MADDNATPIAPENAAPAAPPEAPSASENAAPASNEGTSKAPEGNDEAKKVVSAEDKAKAETEAAAKQAESDNEEPPVRKTRAEYIEERKQQKAAKDEAARKEKQQNTPPKPPDGEEDAITPEEEARIEKIVEKRYGIQLEAVKDISEKTHRQEVDAEVSKFLGDKGNDIFKNFETKIRNFAHHPSRANMPISAIAYEVAGPHLMKMGAEMERKAREEAKDSEAGGSSARQGQGGGKKPYAEMSIAEFEAETRNVIMKRK